MYIKGTRWRVIADGCYLDGMRSDSAWAWTAVKIPLKRGDVIECLGPRMTIGDGMLVTQFIGPKGERLAQCQFRPDGLDYRNQSSWLDPKPGCLEPVL